MWKFFLLLLLSGCGAPCSSPYRAHHFFDQFPPPWKYSFEANAQTPQGILVDTSNQPVDLTALDALVDSAENCLVTTFGIPPAIPFVIRESAQCDSNAFPLPLLRKDLRIKIAADWIESCDGTQELLPALAPDAGCEAKGLTPTVDCPCRWRAGIQDNDLIVVTPDLHMLKDPLVRMATGCNDVWTEPLAACVTP